MKKTDALPCKHGEPAEMARVDYTEGPWFVQTVCCEGPIHWHWAAALAMWNRIQKEISHA